MTTLTIINTVRAHLTELGLPKGLVVLPPGDTRIPEKGGAKHPDKSLLLFERELTGSEAAARNKLQQALPSMTVTNYGVFFKETNGKVEAVTADPVYTKDNGKAATTFPVKSEMVERKFFIKQLHVDNNTDVLKDLEGWEIKHEEFKAFDTGVQPTIWYMARLERTKVMDPTPDQPQPAVSAEAPKSEALKADAIIEPGGQPEPTLERIVTQARKSAAALWRAESNARIQAAVYAGMDAAAAYTARQRITPSVPLFGKVVTHVGAS